MTHTDPMRQAIATREAEAIQQRAAQWHSTGIKVSGRATVGDVVGSTSSQGPAWMPQEVIAHIPTRYEKGRYLIRNIDSDEESEVDLFLSEWTFGSRLQAPPNAPHSVKKDEQGDRRAHRA